LILYSVGKTRCEYRMALCLVWAINVHYSEETGILKMLVTFDDQLVNVPIFEARMRKKKNFRNAGSLSLK